MDWNKILTDLFSVLIVAAIPYLTILIGKLINSLIASIKAPVARHLAYDAVNWALDKFGPDGSGKDKLAAAKAFLIKKTGISDERADVLIRSAYQQLKDMFPKEVPVLSGDGAKT